MISLCRMRCKNFAALLCGCLGLGWAALSARAQNGVHPAPIPIHQPVPLSLNNPYTPNYPTIAFDAESKQYDARAGEMTAPFTFHLTNVWSNEIVISQVHPSCGCTTAQMPATPWHIPPGGSGEVKAQVNLMGKPPGLIVKTLTFFTSVGNRIVMLKVNIPKPGQAMASMTPEERKAALMQAQANPQAIFRADCAKCHVEKGVNAFGQDLYAADCGICHESSHRDSAVPDLHALKQPTDYDYWKTLITYGKPHTMMPAFAHSRGGPLSDDQVESLARYLDRTISHHLPASTRVNSRVGYGSPPASRTNLISLY